MTTRLPYGEQGGRHPSRATTSAEPLAVDVALPLRHHRRPRLLDRDPRQRLRLEVPPVPGLRSLPRCRQRRVDALATALSPGRRLAGQRHRRRVRRRIGSGRHHGSVPGDPAEVAGDRAAGGGGRHRVGRLLRDPARSGGPDDLGAVHSGLRQRDHCHRHVCRGPPGPARNAARTSRPRRTRAGLAGPAGPGHRAGPDRPGDARCAGPSPVAGGTARGRAGVLPGS